MWGILLQVVAPIAIAGVGWLGKQLIGLVGAQKKNAQSQLAKTLLEVLERTVETVVAALEQTLRKELGGVAGKLDYSGAIKLRQAAMDRVKSMLGASWLKQLSSALGVSEGEVTRLIENKIEAAVLRLKRA